ncbi:peptidoglycan-binding protein [Sanguibacter suaedae]|uniref:Peptidoglycan-binding protein n=1 Tax=Sanguibacter suaedae TaxID=2795737 RepID=A0A934MAG0_9MICO|nr:peptidoglycan-binding protein [Sanguibacter suaedae]MBI9115723.1 peptidoglycan-binding protein [Sanguibacter suaedae]
MALVVAFLVGTQVRSPWESAIANSHADPLVTAEVTTRSLGPRTTPVTGRVRLGTDQTVLAMGTDPQVVTGVQHGAGELLMPGQVLATVSGRPVIALDLPFPLYRDVLPGDEGDDVRVLQQALAALGFYTGTVDGRYGEGTARAIEALYAGAGASAPSPSAEADALVAAAEDAVAEALAAESTSSSDTGAPDGPTAAAVSARAVADARTDLTEARFAALTPLPMSEVTRVGAEGATVLTVAGVGTVLGEDPLATLRSGSPSVTARVDAAQVTAFEIGSTVQTTKVGDPGVAHEATVVAIGEFDTGGGDEGALPGRDITLSLDDATGLEDGSDILVTATGTAPAVEGLSVPVVALREDAGSTFVLRDAGGDGSGNSSAIGPEDRVDVDVLATNDGYAIVDAADLREGDRVVVSGSR